MTTDHKKSKKEKLLQNAVNLLNEVQKQASGLKDETNDEISKLIKKVKGSYQDIGSKVAVVSSEAKKQAKEGVGQLLQTWNENKSHLPDKLTNEVDRLLDRVGLVPKAKPATKAKPKAAKPATNAKPKTPRASAKKSAAAKTPRSPKAPSTKSSTDNQA